MLLSLFKLCECKSNMRWCYREFTLFSSIAGLKSEVDVGACSVSFVFVFLCGSGEQALYLCSRAAMFYVAWNVCMRASIVSD